VFKKILIPVDVQELSFSEASLDDAVKYAGTYRAAIHLLTVVPGYGMPIVAGFFPEDAMKKARRNARSRLKRFAEIHVPEKIPLTLVVREGRPYEEIVNEAERVEADLIVMPSHNRRGLHGVLLGSVADNVVEHAHCSVLVVRNTAD
jgi:universal stress protein F